MDSNHNIVEKAETLVEEVEDDLRRVEGPGTEQKRVILLIDVDCFEEQVWRQRFRKDLEGQDVPIVVVNLDKRIVAVNYTAKSKGIVREGQLEEYIHQHPDLVVIKTAERHGKQDTFTPQEYSDNIFRVLTWYKRTLRDPTSITIERSSKDEMYIDVTDLVSRRCRQPLSQRDEPGLRLPDSDRIAFLTEGRKTNPNENFNGRFKTVMEGRQGKISGDQLNYRIRQVYKQDLRAYHEDEIRLIHGAVIADTILRIIQRRTRFQASAGVAHNKLLAKLACDRNKPEGICIIADIAWNRVGKSLAFRDINGYGGIIGEKLQKKLSELCGKNMETIWDILTLQRGGSHVYSAADQDMPLDILEEAFGAIGIEDSKSRALDLLNKCHGRDTAKVTQRHFADTLTTSVSLTGNRSVGTWNEFVSRVEDLSKDMAEKIDYQIGRWKRWPAVVHVKATLHGGAAASLNPMNSYIPVDGCISWEELEKLVLDYVDSNQIHFREIDSLQLKADRFRRCN